MMAASGWERTRTCVRFAAPPWLPTNPSIEALPQHAMGRGSERFLNRLSAKSDVQQLKGATGAAKSGTPFDVLDP